MDNPFNIAQQIILLFINRNMEKKNNQDMCAPGKEYSEGSCLSTDSLIKIAKAYNEHSSIENKKIIPMIFEKRFLVKELYARLKHVCDDQLCWIKQDFVRQLRDSEIDDNTFRPRGPSNNLNWLNTDNINKVIKQYYKLYSDFRFFGAVPIDFDDLPVLGIKNLDFEELYQNNIHKLGFVFNLDEHWKSGSHWVAMYSNIKTNEIYFFDSYGIKPHRRIQTLMKRIEKFCRNRSGKTPTVKYNKIRHQFKNTECGVYSTNFILRLLKGETFDDITKNITNDNDMSKCRRVYFNKDND